jgi:hypothetical protein
MSFCRSEIGVPCTRSVNLEPVSIVAEIFFEYWPSTKKLLETTPV